METLLEKARTILATSKAKAFDKEELEVVVAFLHSEITARQAAAVLGKTRANVYSKIGSLLRTAVTRGDVKIVKKDRH